MNINGREIGPGHPPYIIAEVSCNHGGMINRALQLIQAAKDCGADAVKFQAVTANTITLDCDRPEFKIERGPWAGRNLYDLYQQTQTPFGWFKYIKKQADDIGITWFASVFDKTAVDLMVSLDAPAIKIASFELVDLPLIWYAAATGKPMILSTGMASLEEIKDAIRTAVTAPDPTPRIAGMRWGEQESGIPRPALLHCISGYPTPAAEANLAAMVAMRSMLGCVTGISDHGGSEIPIAATALGANIIEKHFRLSSHPDTEDSPFSIDEEQFAYMVRSVRWTWEAMQPNRSVTEESSRPLRRSLFAVQDIKAGELFTKDNVRSIRPGHGLAPAELYRVLAKKASRDIERGEPMSLDMIDGR
jgi:N-acetylneuraminate synthase